jgi:HEAT repeat protein
MRVAPIYPGEGRAVGFCLAVNFLVFAGIMFGRNSRDALFLIFFGPQYLPYMYFANAVFLILCSLIYTVWVDRIDRGKFLAGVSLLFAGSLVISRLVLVSHPHWFFPVLYLQAQVIWYFSLMQFWTFVGDLFDTRQAKRVFPVLSVGGLLGMMGVGLSSHALTHALGTENLLLVWSGLILFATLLAAMVHKGYRTAPTAAMKDVTSLRTPTRPTEWQKLKHGFAEVGREPLLRSMAGYIVLMWTVYTVVDFCFNKTLRARYQDPNDLTSFLGVFVGVQGILCLLVQLLLTRPLIARLGVGVTINFHPGFLVAGTALMSSRYGFAPVFSAKLADATMLYTFSDSSYQLLYNPISPESRPRVRGFIEGYLRPLSLAIAGGMILLGNTYLRPQRLAGREVPTVQQLSWGALGLAIVWLGFASTAKNSYLRALLRNLQGDSPALRLAAINALSKLKDPANVDRLSQILRSERPERVVAAVQILENLGTVQAAEALADLLAHADPHVRATAAVALGRLAPMKYFDRLLPLLKDTDMRVRANAVEALAATGNPRMLNRLRPLLKDPSLRVRVNTYLALAVLRGGVPEEDWLPMLRGLAQGDSLSRATAAYALAQLPLPESLDLLLNLLRDPELKLRCQAAKALGRLGLPQAMSPLVEALAGPHDLRRAARRSLAPIAERCGSACVRALTQQALNSGQPIIRSELADVLGRLHDPQVTATLITLLKDPHWRVRWKVLKSFERRALSGPLPENARNALFQYAEEELGGFRKSLNYSRALASQPSSEAQRILATALEEDWVRIEERVFHMLGILYGREQMRTIFQKLNSGDARQRADALEAFDTLAPKALGRELLALLEPEPPADPTPPPLQPALAALARHPKPWLRACTAYYVGNYPSNNGPSILQPLLTDREGVVRETALYAAWQAFRDAWKPQVEAAIQSSDVALKRAAQRILSTESDGATEPKTGRILMLLTIEKVLLLKSVPLFSGLDGEELAALADLTLETYFQAHEVIFEQGDPAHHLYIVVCGKVEAFHRAGSKELPVAIFGKEEFFGEMALLDDQPRTASVRALEPVQVLKVDRESFHELILERPQIAFAVLRLISSRLRHTHLEIEQVGAFDSARHFT